MLLFFYGSHPKVSLLELKSVIHSSQIIDSYYGAFVNITREEGAEAFQKLGGFPRVVEIISEFDASVKRDVLLAAIVDYFHKKDIKKYVVSHFGGTERILSAIDIMHALKDGGLKAKFSGKMNERYASPTSAFYLIRRKGSELCLVKDDKKLYLCITVEVQDPNYWSLIDFERPRRDQHIGMLPSKLARIMVNMANLQKGEVILDPFVGQGTIAMQAAVLGINSVGSDKSDVAVEYAKENMDWLLQKGLIPRMNADLFVADITQDNFDGIKADGIATETFLGSMRSKPFALRDEAKQTYEKGVVPLLQALLAVAEKTLVKGQRVVFINPIYKFLDKKIVKWYNPEIRFNRNVWKRIQVSQRIDDNIWIQKDSTIGREIVVLEKGQ